MKAIVFDRHGDPADVLHVTDVPVPEPGFRQVRVRMRAAPVNPSDLLTIEGNYGKRPPLPAIPGYEGVGIVEATGGGLLGWLRKGKRVALINAKGGTWQQQCVVPAKHVVPIPDSVSDEQAAMFFVNPISAVAMTRFVLRVPQGAWLLQTAAGSALGRMVMRLGKLHGFRTINIVRRRDLAAEVHRSGGDICIVDGEEDVEARVREITAGEGVPFVLDAVGGPAGTKAVRCLGPGGRAILYGILSGKPIEVDARFMITGSKRVEGFWLSDWLPRQGIARMLGVFSRVKRLLKQGDFKTEIAGSYSMEQVRDAMKHVQMNARGGKVLLTLA